MKLKDFPIRAAVSSFFQSRCVWFHFNLGLVQWYWIRNVLSFHLEFNFVLLMFSLQKSILRYYISAGCSMYCAAFFICLLAFYSVIYSTTPCTVSHNALCSTFPCLSMHCSIRYTLRSKQQQYASLHRHQQRSVDTYKYFSHYLLNKTLCAVFTLKTNRTFIDVTTTINIVH